ncbi:hypothetical protein SteCoe_18119 [Stentor coeruleus]|uniref:Fumarylacetoacetase-like C-terminal domain-containing protein n=1 Tax=Stentor coeruleus TaxID=5963 RepID=A0A1R2BXL6_9CILI|nr:hypothetical protein SteCoe_18119 [Stentor coeruleus]
MDSHILKLLNSNKIFGMAWNWKGGAKVKPFPVIFQKVVSSIIPSGGTVILPKSETVLHELELACFISKKAKNVPKSEAMDYIKGYCLALDMTSPSILKRHKEDGLSWDIGKGYDTFLPLSQYFPAKCISNPSNIDLELTINNQIRQKGNTKNFVFGIPEIIEYLSNIFTLNEGDLILTGTPSGASPVNPGDILHGKMLENGKIIAELSAKIQSAL